MENENLTRGLEQLADEVEPRPVDVQTVISRARARKQNRRAMLAVGGATVAVLVGAIVVTAAATSSNNQPAVARPTSTQTTKDVPHPIAPVFDAQSRKFDSQLAAARAELILPRFTVSGDNPVQPVMKPLMFDGTPGPKGETNYTAKAMLTDSEGTATIQIWVLKNPPGTPLGHYNGQTLGPCIEGQKHCEHRTLHDGTVVAVQPNANPSGITLSSAISAQRPDGTYIQVLVNVGEGTSPKPLADAPYTADELVKFATAFTW
nr:hypothetical protein [Kibdelosporangium sp. MJ126-NF4]CEL18478.1 hypothetical protein [Kibdelosporangium sp. MJ126-NF4]CTQ97962.1 hypothetical protein [Kibdelosporangium sp. MJ126-NF4]